MGTWETLHHAKFCKNCLRGYTLLDKYIPKITNFCDFGDLSPHRFGKNPLRGHTYVGQIVTKNTDFGDFRGCKPTFLKPKELKLALGCGPMIPSPCKIL